MRYLGVAASTAGLMVAVAVAAPAGATEDEFLRDLQPRYSFLTAEELVTQGYRACAATSVGVLAPDAVQMISADLGISTGAAMDIVSRALLRLC
ncbi:hypothetical protein AU198_04915 [Mycobacterium sp. GA-1199]|uniref:DUF732 domain-containing protein n=1 Tax=Mycobacterium sp. GA-1199 TaxID=1772287 RepID=UPI00074A93CA|nr:DUF732 domain-containing protein [Mycobacterium sp. GA-1199]KUI47943.1 hypothetical protein AU198_04915 [Mycobacterium sp. GA-1199]